jgi:hypothetical protein
LGLAPAFREQLNFKTQSLFTSTLNVNTRPARIARVYEAFARDVSFAALRGSQFLAQSRPDPGVDGHPLLRKQPTSMINCQAFFSLK